MILQGTLSVSLSLLLSLFLTLSLINNYIHAYMCLTVGRQSRDHRPLSRDPSVSFYKKFPNCLKRPKTLFDSRPTVAWPQPLSRDRSATFFKIFPNRLKRPKNVVWQSADGRLTSYHCRVTVQRLFSKKFLIAWNVEKSLFDSRPTVAWPPTTVTWPFSDFFQKNFQLLETSKNRCLTVGRWSRDLRPLSHGITYCLADVYLVYLLLLYAKSLITYLLLQEWSDPGNFDIISKLGIGRREILILAGKFQLVDSPWGEQVPHYKHRRSSITYLLREIPVKNGERRDRSQQTGKLSG